MLIGSLSTLEVFPGEQTAHQTVPIDPETGLPSGDNGIQRITVIVSHNGNPVLTLEDYKVDR